MQDVSGLTSCRAYAIRLAVQYIAKQGTTAVSLPELQKALELTENQMYTIRREINKQDDLEDGRIKYLHPKDKRLVVHIPLDEENPQIIMAVEAALLNLELDDKSKETVKDLLTDFLKELINPNTTETKDISHA